MHIIVSSAYPLSSPKGNTVTAKRITDLLYMGGHTAEAINSDMPPSADAMIALHATKTLDSSKYFKAQYPKSKLIIYLTGTDLYQDQPNRRQEFYDALNLADALVISQESSLNSVPGPFRSKTFCVHPSVFLPEESTVPAPPKPSFALVGHLRPVKNPFLLNRALDIIRSVELHAYTLGSALDPDMVKAALEWQYHDPRFKWLYNVPYPQALSWMRQVDFTLNTSHSEGGSNAVAESIALGTPVLASRIEGNVGLLGDDYEGYFEPDNAASLAKLIDRAIHDSSFSDTLHAQIESLQPKFHPDQEIDAWLKIL
ncbi:glycosyltransferase [Rubritalea tangerina]|uniref:Glycosyltransferase n=1 Tax=Rubritalea tangerina TaxID=430798 RepID=A0ABW4ZFE7_9BACT